jgi:histidine-specific SAM-dependent methyltransferase/TIR domain-containing protein
MGGVFISHAAADKEFVSEFVDNVVRLGSEASGEKIFYSSGADTGVPTGEDLNSFIRDKVEGVGLVIAVITPEFQASSFCVAELGAAWGKVGKLFPLKVPQLDRADLDGVLKGVMIRDVTNGDALDELHDRILAVLGSTSKSSTWSTYKKRWLQAANGLLPRPEIQKADTLSRQPREEPAVWGQVFEGIVDAALYTADDSVARNEIIDSVKVHTLIPGRYLYSSDSGADNWVRLCKDRSYRHHWETVDYWSSRAGRRMAKAIKRELGRDDFDFISLGPGDGKKDTALIESWLDAGSDVLYYPYDVSLPLVSRAIRAVCKNTSKAPSSTLRIKAVLADFYHLQTLGEVFKHRDSPNVIALLGNSLGNLENELDFLHELHRAMSDDDLLVIEVRLKSDDGRLPELATPKSLRFDFGPLEHYLGLPFDEGKMDNTTEDELSSIPGATTTVVFCKGIEIPGANSDEAKLMYIHEYDEEAFLTAIEDRFEIVEHKEGSKRRRFLVCVLRKK